MKIHPAVILAGVHVLFISFGAAASTYYVSAGSGNDANSGLDWGSAKQTIQAAIDAASNNDRVLVSNGVYNTGSRLSPGQALCKSRVVIDKALTVHSVNGPANTRIVGQGPLGDGAIRCVWMISGATLSGFTLTNGFTTTLGSGFWSDDSGGGVFCQSANASITNCILSSNSAYSGGGGAYNATLNNCTLTGNTARYGGGAYLGTLNNCTLSGNSAINYGGGADNGPVGYGITLHNCTLWDNTAQYGGGVSGGTLYNCTLWGNTAQHDGGGAYYALLRNSIIHANVSSDLFNATTASCFTNDPHFVNAPAGNFRLQASSPCINAGLNALAPTNITPYDLDGNPRISGGTVDIGAYEYQFLSLIYASAGPNGSIDPSGLVQVAEGGSQLFTMLPSQDYEVQDVQTNGGSVGAVTNFTWSNVTGVNTIYVSFVRSTTSNGSPHWWLTDGLVAYYPFNGNANDESGYGNHGTVYEATLTADYHGNTNGAYLFGTSKYISVPNSPSLRSPSNTITISAWHKIDSFDRLWGPILSKQSPSSYCLIYYRGNNRLDVQIADSVNTLSSIATSPSQITGRWHHIAATYNSSQIVVYIDGKQDGVTNVSLAFPDDLIP